MRDMLILTVFARTADDPMPARWTKVVTSLHWFVLGFAVHNLLSRVFEVSFDPLRQKTCILPGEQPNFSKLTQMS